MQNFREAVLTSTLNLKKKKQKVTVNKISKKAWSAPFYPQLFACYNLLSEYLSSKGLIRTSNKRGPFLIETGIQRTTI